MLWNHPIFIFLWLAYLLGIMSSSFIHVVAYWNLLLSFYSIHYVYTIIYLFICQWIYRLFPYFDYYEYCCNKYGSVNTSFWDSDFKVFEWIIRSVIAWSYSSSIFNFWVISIMFSIKSIQLLWHNKGNNQQSKKETYGMEKMFLSHMYDKQLII